MHENTCFVCGSFQEGCLFNGSVLNHKITQFSFQTDGESDDVGKELTDEIQPTRSGARGTSDTSSSATMATTANNTFVDRIDPFAKRSLKKKQKKSQGSSRYHQANEADLVPLPLFKGKLL